MAHGKVGARTWWATDSTARDAIGSDHGLQVNATISLDDGTRHRCTVVGGAATSTWVATADSDLAGTLALGNTTGGTDIEVSAGDQIIATAGNDLSLAGASGFAVAVTTALTVAGNVTLSAAAAVLTIGNESAPGSPTTHVEVGAAGTYAVEVDDGTNTNDGGWSYTAADSRMHLRAADANRVSMSSAAMWPTTHDGMTLGTSGAYWGEAWITDMLRIGVGTSGTTIDLVKADASTTEIAFYNVDATPSAGDWQILYETDETWQLNRYGTAYRSIIYGGGEASLGLLLGAQASALVTIGGTVNTTDAGSILLAGGNTSTPEYQARDASNALRYDINAATWSLRIGSTDRLQQTAANTTLTNASAVLTMGDGTGGPTQRYIKSDAANTLVYFSVTDAVDGDGDYILWHGGDESFEINRHDGVAWRHVLRITDDTAMTLLGEAQGTAVLTIGPTGTQSIDQRFVKSDAGTTSLRFFNIDATASDGDFTLQHTATEALRLFRHDGTAYQDVLTVSDDTAMTIMGGAQGSAQLQVGNTAFATGDEATILLQSGATGTPGVQFDSSANAILFDVGNTQYVHSLSGVGEMILTATELTLSSNNLTMSGTSAALTMGDGITTGSPRIDMVKGPTGSSQINFYDTAAAEGEGDWQILSDSGDDWYLRYRDASAFRAVIYSQGDQHLSLLTEAQGPALVTLGNSGFGADDECNLLLLGGATSDPTLQFISGSDGAIRYNAASPDFVFSVGGTQSATLSTSTLSLLHTNAILTMGDGLTAGSPHIDLLKGPTGTQALNFYDTDTTASTDDYRLYHDASENFHIQHYTGGAWTSYIALGLASQTLSLLSGESGGTVQVGADSASFSAVTLSLADFDGDAVFEMNKGAAQENLIYFYSGDNTASDGDYAIRHDASEDWSLERHNGSAWIDVINVTDDDAMTLLTGVGSTVTVSGSLDAARSVRAQGIVIDGDNGSGIASTITHTNDSTAVTSGTLTVIDSAVGLEHTVWIKFFDGTVTTYFPGYTAAA